MFAIAFDGLAVFVFVHSLLLPAGSLSMKR